MNGLLSIWILTLCIVMMMGGCSSFLKADFSVPGIKDNGVPGAFATRLAYITSTDSLMSPVWSPDGVKLALILSKGGNLDIYVYDLTTRKLEAVTRHYAIDTEPAWLPDGKLPTMVTREAEDERIAVLDLESGAVQVLSQGSLDESPSFAPNGSMVIYVTKRGDKSVLEAVSVDGLIRQRFALQAGDVREPAWSPYL